MKRTDLIQNVKSGLAEQNRQIQTGADFGLQQSIRAQARERAMNPASQQGAQDVAAVSQRRGQAAQAQTQQATQQAQFEEQKAKMSQARTLAEMQDTLSKQTRENEGRLFQLDQRLKDNLLDKQLTFQKDELGRALFNERQLADYKLATAKSQEDLKNYQQMVQQETQKKLQILEFAHNKMKQELANTMKLEESRKNNELKIRLQRAINEAEKKIAKEKADAANRAGMASGIGSILGLGVGVAATAATGGGAAPLIPAFAQGGGAIGTMTAK